jgi:hypothetical protein
MAGIKDMKTMDGDLCLIGYDFHSWRVFYTWKLSGGNLYTCIRPNQEQPQKMQLQVPGRNRTCDSAIRIVFFCFVDQNTMYLVTFQRIL